MGVERVNCAEVGPWAVIVGGGGGGGSSLEVEKSSVWWS